MNRQTPTNTTRVNGSRRCGGVPFRYTYTIVATFGLIAIASNITHAVTPATLIDLELQPHRVHLHSIAQGQISYFDSNRQLHAQPISRFVQLRTTRPSDRDPLNPDQTATAEESGPDPHDRLGRVELTDGQQIHGQWAGVGNQGDCFHWRHPVLGRLTVSLDRLHRLTLDRRAIQPDQPDPPSDRIQLANGDTISGFVTGLNPKGIVLQPQGSNQAMVVPLSQVRVLTLAGPPQRQAARDQNMVWLSDGSRVLASLTQLASDQLTLQLALSSDTPPVTLPMADVGRIDLATDDGYLLDLVDTPMGVVRAGQPFGLSTQPQIRDAAIHLHAPVKVRFDLPPGATRLAATAQLHANPQQTGPRTAWSDCQIILQSGDQISHHHLTPSQPASPINMALTGRGITLELDPARNGPVMDRVVLTNAFVLVRPATQTAPTQEIPQAE